jgi:hypothetical protein
MNKNDGINPYLKSWIAITKINYKRKFYLQPIDKEKQLLICKNEEEIPY